MLPLRRRDLREARRTAIAALTLTLSVVEQALSDIPVPGASAAVGAVGEVIRGIAVSVLASLYCDLASSYILGVL